MSTIAARAHQGPSLSAPVRRAAPLPRRKMSWLGRVARMALQRPGRALVLVVFAGVSAAILANALILQKARHPAPMISAPSVAPSQTPSARQAERRAEQPASSSNATATMTPTPAPLPPSRPNDLAQQAREAQPREAVTRPPAAVTNVPRTAAAQAPAPAARAAAPRDPIADLINGGDIRPPADVRGVASAKSSAPRRSAEN